MRSGRIKFDKAKARTISGQANHQPTENPLKRLLVYEEIKVVLILLSLVVN